MWRRWGTPQNFLLEFIDELWKTQKIRIFGKWKKLLEISSIYTCVPKTTIIWGTVPDKQSETNFLSFWAIFPLLTPPPPPPPTTQTQKTQVLKNWKQHLWKCHHFKSVQQKNTIKWCMLTQIWSTTDIIFCHFRSFFALLLHYWPQKLKFGKNVKNSWTY